MKTFATLLAIGQSLEEPVFGYPSSEEKQPLIDAGISIYPYKKIHVSTCLEKFGPLEINNVKIECNTTKGKGYCELKGCDDGYMIANQYRYTSKILCYTDKSETLVKGFEVFVFMFDHRRVNDS